MPALLLTVLLATAPPGDAVGLAPDPAPAEAPPSPSSPAPSEPRTPIFPLGSLAAAAALLAAGVRPVREHSLPGPFVGAGTDDDPIVVFVPGHGNVPEDFEDLIGLMGLDPGGYRMFDYRWTVETTDPAHASQAASADSIADALNAYVAGLADGERRVYLVGFSKGGAGIAELVGRWDAGAPEPVPGVIGAALLDPPISGGFQGAVQSLGHLVGPIPDDGGYSPVDCDWPDGCTDRRDHLGEEAGVEVVVLRNPKAGITSFDDRPDGLRVYDVPDEGRGPGAAFFHNPFTYAGRVAEAHEAVLHDPRVAKCILAEMSEAGSCDLPRYQEPLARCGGSGGGGTPVLAD